MSIRFNHATNTMTSTNSASIVVEGGTPSVPRPLRLNASSVVFPNKALPTGEAGAVVFDTASKTLKYHDGFQWVELLSQDEILEPIQISLTEIYNQLANRVSSVTYSSSAVPSASVSGTNLNIVFPTSSGGSGAAVPGLFTSSPPGSIMHYSLTSGQSVASIREQMSGVSGGQNGRNGTVSAPFVTKTGWCFADGMYWTWNGSDGAVTKVVPNLNQEAYLKGITTSGVTKTDAIITGSGTISSTSITMPEHYHGTGMMRGLGGDHGDDGVFIIGKTWNDGRTYTGAIITGDKQQYWTTAADGSDTRRAFTTTYPIYQSGNTSTHTHNLTGIDVGHFNVAVLYNIAEPSLALNQANGDARYVLKSGDVMSGSLTIANSAAIQANDTNLILWFRNASGGERGAIYHSTTTNTLRFRSAGGTEMALSNTGVLTVAGLTVSSQGATVGGRNIVRSINGSTADANGNVTLSITGGVVTNVRRGAEIAVNRYSLGDESFVYRCGEGQYVTGFNIWSKSNNNDEFRDMYSRPVQILIDGTWRTISDV
ncbi:tail fiber protein [Cronobacter phage vB_CsaM_GAP32]|uniref:Putative tail fiber protein n=1 Tax=Cronobacter phage vB_CsaM_GAP32 TaxID=1141136 RepID=K4FB45_9CAUD|nr:tail fiber protein [Cronobacter phage vB_CsaM_GAP32]AFC21704.1 putative tail fiber protein [Cronobacter phage vB_CsaM_GAP32]